MNWIIRRLKEPSSWRAIFLLAGIAGYSVAPELQEHIMIGVGAALSAIEFIRKEKPNGAE